jgi:hypothetical protein
MFNHYIHCKTNNISFYLMSDEWLFKYKIGWNDYFDYKNLFKYDNHIKMYSWQNTCKDYQLKDYKIAIKDLYIYNSVVKDKIACKTEELGLNNTDYGSIFIRRGDKLINESNLHNTEIYIDLLLHHYPECSTIFIQTDDYNCILDSERYLKGRNINIITLCDKNMRGVFLNNNYIDTTIDYNTEYMKSIKDDIIKYKKVIDMNPDEIYEHALEMIIGLDIVNHSKYCILDYQSNVSRFIKLSHSNNDNVIDINGNNMDMNRYACPAFHSSVL